MRYNAYNIVSLDVEQTVFIFDGAILGWEIPFLSTGTFHHFRFSFVDQAWLSAEPSISSALSRWLLWLATSPRLAYK
jgi:hypothetical protein